MLWAAGGAGARRPKTENRFCHFNFPKKMARAPPKTESRRPNPESLARPGGRGRGPKTENRKPFLPFSQKKMVRASPKTESRGPNPESLARPGGRGRGPKTENRFGHFRPKNGPGTSENRKLKPKAESRKLGPARREGQGPEDRKPFLPFSHKKGVRVPPKTESRRPNPESLARPGGRGRGPKTENRKPFLPFSPKNGPGTSEDRKTRAESRKLGEGQGPEDRKPKTVFAIFPPKKRSGYLRRPKAEGRIPKAWPGGRGRGPKTQNQKCSYAKTELRFPEPRRPKLLFVKAENRNAKTE